MRDHPLRVDGAKLLRSRVKKHVNGCRCRCDTRRVCFRRIARCVDARCRLVEKARGQVGQFLSAADFYYGDSCQLVVMVASFCIKLGCVAALSASHRRRAVGVDVD